MRTSKKKSVEEIRVVTPKNSYAGIIVNLTLDVLRRPLTSVDDLNLRLTTRLGDRTTDLLLSSSCRSAIDQRARIIACCQEVHDVAVRLTVVETTILGRGNTAGLINNAPNVLFTPIVYTIIYLSRERLRPQARDC